MSRLLKLLMLALVGGAVWAALHWPRLNDVETGRTAEYPDLRPRDYGANEAAVRKAAQAAVAALPRWTFVASGHGPGGTEVQAIARSRVFRFPDDITVRIRRQGARTLVSVRSRSRHGKWDFGQNARNIRLFLTELDRQMFGS